MEITQELFLDLLGREDTRFVIPVFQRVYSWDARQCEELWDDVMRAGAAEAGDDTHFMGMLLYSPDSETWNGATQLNVIDGQQRMTTMSLLLCALARHLDETGRDVDGVTARDVFGRYLRLGDGASVSGKLVLSYMDRDTLFALVGKGAMPEEPAGRLIDNLELFYAKMQEPDFDVRQLWRGLERLEVAGILLGHDDRPQLVFESLNSKGMALSTADRIRNFIVVTDGADDGDDGDARAQGGVFERCWLPLEKLLAGAPEGLTVTTAVNAWLAGKYRDLRIFDESEVYGVFKRCLRDEYAGDIEPALADIAAYASELLADEDMRTEELENASRWVAGKPKELVSEYKMFGD